MKNLMKTVQAFNEAYEYFGKTVKLLDQNVEKTPQMEHFLWKFAKAFKDVNREVMKQLKKRNIDEQFLNMMKDF